MFGLPYIIAPMEAEAQCAYMELANIVDGVVTDDSDVFLFGSRSVYKNIFDDRKYVETYFMKVGIWHSCQTVLLPCTFSLREALRYLLSSCSSIPIKLWILIERLVWDVASLSLTRSCSIFSTDCLVAP